MTSEPSGRSLASNKPSKSNCPTFSVWEELVRREMALNLLSPRADVVRELTIRLSFRMSLINLKANPVLSKGMTWECSRVTDPYIFMSLVWTGNPFNQAPFVPAGKCMLFMAVSSSNALSIFNEDKCREYFGKFWDNSCRVDNFRWSGVAWISWVACNPRSMKSLIASWQRHLNESY